MVHVNNINVSMIALVWHFQIYFHNLSDAYQMFWNNLHSFIFITIATTSILHIIDFNMNNNPSNPFEELILLATKLLVSMWKSLIVTKNKSETMQMTISIIIIIIDIVSYNRLTFFAWFFSPLPLNQKKIRSFCWISNQSIIRWNSNRQILNPFRQ